MSSYIISILSWQLIITLLMVCANEPKQEIVVCGIGGPVVAILSYAIWTWVSNRYAIRRRKNV